jgi:tRNA(Ile)-lysidine synthase
MNKSMPTSLLSQYSFTSILSSFPRAEKIWIACSGGMDSSVLLHLVHSNRDNIKQSLEVIHVNHGLQEKSVEWGEFCRNQCQDYGISFTQLDIEEAIPKGSSIEAWAREKRYALIAQVMNKNDILFTAHHQDDQVETFFLQALRGAGPRGLSSMPVFKNFVNGIHARPLLGFKRCELLSFAKDNELPWHEDLSNADTKYDRNYFRHNILPAIEQRWPAYRETISRLIGNQQDSKSLLNEIGLEDLKLALYENTQSLRLDVVKNLSAVRQKNLIFAWLQERQLKSPGSRHIEQIISDLINSKSDNTPCVNWQDVEIRRYRNLLYASNSMDEEVENIDYDWDIDTPLKIMGETLIAKSEIGLGLSKEKIKNTKIIVRYRQGGEKIQPHNKSHSKTVKQLFQECGVLPWLRDRFPLIYVNGTLAVIPGLCVDKNYAAAKGEASWQIEWSGYDKTVQL